MVTTTSLLYVGTVKGLQDDTLRANVIGERGVSHARDIYGIPIARSKLPGETPTMRLSRKNSLLLIFGGAVVAAVLASCSSLGAKAGPAELPGPAPAAKDCAQEQNTMISAGFDVAQPVPVDSLGATTAAQFEYAKTIAAFHVCLSSH